MAGNNTIVDGLLRVLRDVAGRALDRATRPKRKRPQSTARTHKPPRPTTKAARKRTDARGSGYPGDYQRQPHIVYQPHRDGRPDPGEIVWTWVPFEEDHAEGKDRPVLLIGRDGPWLLGLQVSTVDREADHKSWEAKQGRYWIDIGAGEWDSQRRPSEVRVNRILRIDPDAVRRIGAMLDEPRFDAVAAEVRRHY